jgi:hypothetical protein
MWAVNQECPNFEILTPAGPIGPRDSRGEWLALLHCGRPCVPRCQSCVERFGSLSKQFRLRNCRLLVALDEPDGDLRTRLERGHPETPADWTIGRWNTPEDLRPGVTQFSLIDPKGIVRVVTDSHSAGPIRGELLLGLLDRAQERAVIPVLVETELCRLAHGCVEWFDYPPDAQHA